MLLDGVTELVMDKVKKQEGGFWGMLFGTLGASLLGNFLGGRSKSGKDIMEGGVRTGEGVLQQVNQLLML